MLLRHEFLNNFLNVISIAELFLLLVLFGPIQANGLEIQLKTESTRKLSNLNFKWTKTLYQNNLKNILHSFFFVFQMLKM